MQTVLIVLLSILIPMETFSQNITTDRNPVAAGKFYPANKETLIKDLAQLFADCKKTAGNQNVRAIISPHAGFIYSGKIAAAAYSTIPRNTKFKNIFLIGSSHVMGFNGASVYNTGDFITPFGKVIVNREIADKLISGNKVFKFPVTAHLQEHSLENQLPFIQYYFKVQPTIVPIVIGTNDKNTIRKIAEALHPWFVPENLFVISSDFSHYPSYNDAVETDSKTASGILSGSSTTFLNTLAGNDSKRIPGLATSMCGWTSGLTLLYLSEADKNIEIKLIDYCNSGDLAQAGKNEVVGYNAIAFFDKKSETAGAGGSFSFTTEERRQLFDIVRKTVRSKLYENKKFVIDEGLISEHLKKPMGAFVTFKLGGTLKGCIGRFNSAEPLYRVVQESAYSSAFDDPRFSHLTMEEYPETDIEITVLGPLKKISDIGEIVLGRHGIYIRKNEQSGTMLPQVASENNWTLEEFLGYTSRDKAGLGWEGWKDAEIFVYEGVVLEE
jgi:AmmeMemoRadiSam system protein B/AmmeMemoRadiSam system protein A